MSLLSIRRGLEEVYAEEDLSKRMWLRIQKLPLSYLSTTEARNDLIALLRDYDYLKKITPANRGGDKMDTWSDVG